MEEVRGVCNHFHLLFLSYSLVSTWMNHAQRSQQTETLTLSVDAAEKARGASEDDSPASLPLPRDRPLASLPLEKAAFLQRLGERASSVLMGFIQLLQ